LDGGMTGRWRTKRKSAPDGLAGPKAEKSISLALQGGGAHGAFTWGVLDEILEDGRLSIEAISGASAGAMNAVVLAEGFLEGGVEGARRQLAQFWQKVSLDGSLTPLQRSVFDSLFGFWGTSAAPSFSWTEALSQVTSPYDLNPLNVNVLKDVIEDLISFDKVRRCNDVRLFVSATNVRTGKIAIFENKDLTADHLMASACLPTLFQTVEIDGVPYWDGGFSGNPALFPLFYQTASDDIVLVQINPIERQETPRSARAIQNRLTEINFNAGLLRELRAVEFVTRLIDNGKLSKKEYKRVLMHRIDADQALKDESADSRLDADWDFFQKLRDIGRSTARAWLQQHYDSIGKEATLDLRETIK
jgi:NTE family protein